MNELILIFGEDGKAHMYNGDFDVTIHCEDEQQMNEAVELRHLANRMHWRKTAECPPTEKDAAYGKVIAFYRWAKAAQAAKWDYVAGSPESFPYWMPMPELPKEGKNCE